MKSIFVMDNPKNCLECKLNSICTAHTYWRDPCLLQPFPEQKNTISIIELKREAEANNVSPQFQTGYNEGWNDCLEAITGEKYK